ncbi:MAG TPA: hypothetical protein VKR42_08160 [Ktedonobacteraceae bacterium]|nr:hypothetical protein [Ktedonobacteraceae bacterium]
MKFSRYLALCILGSTLLLFTSCSSQNNIVNPSPGIWKIVHSVNPGIAQNGLNAVAATSANDAWAVGNFSNNHLNTLGGKALIEHWNGSAWSVATSPKTPLDSSILNGVAAISPVDAWAVGYAFSDSNSNEQQTLIEHWDGATWKIVKSPNPANGNDLFAIAALSATDIWTVGVYGYNLGQTLVTRTLIEHWNGTTWTVVQSSNPGSGFNYLTGLTAISTNDIWAVGFSSSGQTVQGMQETLIEHWNGTAWTVVQSQSPGTNGNTLSAITAISANDVWAVGNTNNDSSVTDTLIEHWNGSAWSTVEGQSPGKESNYLSAVVAVSPHDVWAIGSFNSVFSDQQAQPLIEHWNGSAWSTVASPNIGTNNTTLGGIGLVPHSTNIWAVGSGATFGTVSVPSPNATQPISVMSVTAQTLIESCCS